MGFFSTSLSNIGMTLVNNAEIYKKVFFFQVIVLPISNIFVSYIRFFFQILLFSSVYMYFFFSGFNFNINTTIIFFPFFIIHLSVFTFSLGLIVASVTINIEILDLLYNLDYKC